MNKFTQSQINILASPQLPRRIRHYLQMRQRREAWNNSTTPLDRVKAYLRDHEALRNGRVIAVIGQAADGEGELTLADLKAVLKLVP